MAANPNLIKGVTGELLPAPYQNEYIYLKRDGIKFDVHGVRTSNKKWSAWGSVFLSNYRLSFVAKETDPKTGLGSFEIPLVYIHQHDFKQPVFGCNHIVGKCYVLDQHLQLDSTVAPIQFWINFREGGCNNFVQIFFMLIYKAQRHMANLQKGQQQETDDLQNLDPNTIFQQNQALYDPNDPTVVYLTNQQQPMGKQNNMQQPPQYLNEPLPKV